MADSGQRDLIDRLVGARLNGRRVDLEEYSGPLDEAQTLQVAVLSALEAKGEAVSGWKVGLTSGHAHDLMGTGVRPFGYILANRTVRSGARLDRMTGAPMFIEPELCLELGAPLSGAGLTPDDCRSAVRRVLAAFEINQSRVRMPGRNHLFVADGLANWGLALGSGVKVDEAPRLPMVELFRDGESIRSSEPGLRMDDPFASLATLCDRLSRYGRGIAAGQHVITGAFFRQPIDAPGEYRAVFSGLGEVSLTFD